MAGIFFAVGENKKRAGVYQRYEKAGSPLYAGASDGIVAAVINAVWGATNTVVDVANAEQAKMMFGSNGNTDVITQAFAGGATMVRVCRVGTGGTKGAATLGTLKVAAKYVGTRALKVAVKQSVEDENAYALYLYENGSIIEKFSYIGSTLAKDVAAKVTAESNYIDVTTEGEDGMISACVGESELAGGANPTANNADYSNAFIALEPYRWNTICVDTNATEVHALLAAYMTRVYQDGKTGMAVVGEPITVAFADRQNHAAAFNDYKVAYVGGGWYDAADTLYDGYKAAARLAGMIASTPSNQSITHKSVGSAVRVAEMLTNAQYEACIEKGMITFSHAPSGAVWVEMGINTLVNPTGEDDEGWKKIKRVKVRFELMDRVNDSVAPLVGTVNNDADGRATVIQTVQGILNRMVSERKLAEGATIIVDDANAPTADSAWFLIEAYDIDTLEKIYFTYKFSFAVAS